MSSELPSSSPRRRWRKRHLAMLAPVALMAFFALRSSPFMGDIAWLPKWFTGWADHNWVFRSFVGFYVFAALWFAIVSRRWWHVRTRGLRHRR